MTNYRVTLRHECWRDQQPQEIPEGAVPFPVGFIVESEYPPRPVGVNFNLLPAIGNQPYLRFHSMKIEFTDDPLDEGEPVPVGAI